MLMRRIGQGANLLGLYEDVDRLLDSEFGGRLRNTLKQIDSSAVAPMNVWEDDEQYFVEVEVPGLTMDNLEVTVVGDELTIKGERSIERGPNVIEHRSERIAGAFARSLRLPVAVASERVDASLKNGLLTITLPKADEVRPKRIEVKACE